MKSKKLLVFLIVLVFIAVLIVVNSTVFTLQNVSVSWLSNTINLKNLHEDDVSSLIEKGDSMFLLDKKEISKKLEKNYPYLRVVGIESKFPNKIVIYSAERNDLYAIKLADNEYAVVDDYGKVLGISNRSVFEGTDIDVKPIEVTFGYPQINPNDFLVGEDIKNEYIKNMLVKLSTTLVEANYIKAEHKKGAFASINICSMGEDGAIGIQFNTRNGMIINILDADNSLTDKLMLGVAVYNKYQEKSCYDGVISVLYSIEESGIIAFFNDNKVDSAV